MRFFTCVLVAAILQGNWPAAAHAEDENPHIQLFRSRSALLSAFWGRDIFHEAGVVLPPDHEPGKPGRSLPVCYNIHGFGGSHRAAWHAGPELIERMRKGESPRMLYVFLNASCPLGHHELADSVNNGPWGQALVTELVPALEKDLGGDGRPEGRFLTGHSSGGWSSLWLQVAYPDFFGGVWSLSPDPVDFRDFSGVNIYADASAYFANDGTEIPLVRKGDGWAMTIQQYCNQEVMQQRHGGQFASFDAVFSPRGEDGQPMPLFDRTTGKIDFAVAKAWEKYDISLVLRRNWAALEPALRGKVHVYCGLSDTFRLEGAVKLLKADLEKLGSDAEILLVEGRDHGSIFAPHPQLWPKGLMERVHREMRERYDRLQWVSPLRLVREAQRSRGASLIIAQ